MSPRRFDGWEPVELHESYDADGNLTGSVVVTREAEWDLQARALAEALVKMEDDTCPGCGNDLNHTLTVHEPYDVDVDTVCWACRARSIVERMDSDQHKAQDEKAPPGTPKRSDGRIYPVRPMTMDELELEG